MKIAQCVVLANKCGSSVYIYFKLFPVQKKNSFSFFFKTYFKRDFHYFSHFNHVPIANPSQLLDLDINNILKFLFSQSLKPVQMYIVHVLRQKLKRRVRRHKFCSFVHYHKN